MDPHFRALCLTYHKAPIAFREKIALDEASCKRLMQQLREFTDAQEILILSTCNRTEVYYSAHDNCTDAILSFLGIEKNIPDLSQHKDYFESFDQAEEAIQHLFEVSMGLDSQVVGDMQISNQVKLAYQWSADVNMAGPFLHRLMHTIFFTNKRVVQETSFRDGAASASYATVELVEELLLNHHQAKICIVGLGEMGTDVVRNLSNTAFENITICNRSIDKAQALANECNVAYIPFEQLNDFAQKADLIISAAAVQQPIFTKPQFETSKILTTKYFIDLSVPRSIDSKIEDIHGCIVYDIDHIQNKSNEALAKRIESIPHVRSIITESISEFNEWSKEMIVSPTINKLKNTLEQIRKEEIARHLKQLNSEESKKVDEITRSIMQKIIKLPVLQLKAACKRGEAETLIDVLNDLFNLEKQSEPIED
jgi:glutamyl-tRNA reductase